jgi:hypothetical protein
VREDEAGGLDTTEQDKRSTAWGQRQTIKKTRKEKWMYVYVCIQIRRCLGQIKVAGCYVTARCQVMISELHISERCCCIPVVSVACIGWSSPVIFQ